jgi:muramoyltetrapeptide carboxypeptidase
MQMPPFLHPGDTIGIAASARKVSPDEIEAALAAAHSYGYKTILADNIYQAENQFSGTDLARAKGINQLLHNPKVKAIWCARGGYGSVRLIDKIDWSQFQKNPKWLCGFSDVTALHLHLQQNHGIASLHSEMMLGFADNTETAHETFFNALAGKTSSFLLPGNALNRPGTASGQFIGGNLSVLYSMLGSQTQPDTARKILFLEDLDEYLYHIDRMMMALHRAGILSNLAGLVVGGLTDMKDNAVPFGKSAEEIIADVVGHYNYPICFNFPAGHIKNNCALVMGAETTLEVADTVTLTQQLA